LRKVLVQQPSEKRYCRVGENYATWWDAAKTNLENLEASLLREELLLWPVTDE
jgi:hypothetical protein